MKSPGKITFEPPDHSLGENQFFYRMPIGFGPFPGPRQIPHPGVRKPDTNRRTIASVTYLTEERSIGEILPDCFEVGKKPTITVEFQKFENLDWLAGRGYSTFGVKIPAILITESGPIEGDFLSVLWENLADPILSGREELGFAKLWCDLSETISDEKHKKYTAHWLEHPFADLEINNLTDSPALPSPARPTFHYKYIPKTGHPGQADASYPVITPANNPHLVVESRFQGAGRFAFKKSSWEELPTLFHIVNSLAEIPLKEFVSASLVICRNGKDLSDQYIPQI